MPEPTDHPSAPFSHFDPEVPVPLSPADIRRRGDRLRRRNTALAVVGGVAAIAIIATPLALSTGGSESTSVGPSTQSPTVTDTPSSTPPATPPATATTTSVLIPGDFPLADHLPATNDVDGTPVVVSDQPAISSLEPCGETVWTADGPGAATVDVAGAAFKGFEDTRTRTLVLYGSDDEAAAALQDIRTGYADCPVDATSGTDQVYAEASSSENESVFTHRYRIDGAFAPGLELIQVHLEGNALLVASYANEGGGSEATIASAIELTDTESSGVYTAMAAAFGDGGTSQSGTSDDPTSGPPAALALGDLPSRQRLDDWTQVDPGSTPALRCVPAGYDLPSVAATFEAPAAGDTGGSPIARIRTVVYTFDTEDAAAGGFAEVSTQLDTCDELLGISPGQPGDSADLGSDRVDWRQFTYSDPEICTDCDGVFFDHMGVAQVGDRLLLLSYAEAGGPVEPKNMDTYMRELLAQAISLA